jgi:hypothetical protein
MSVKRALDIYGGIIWTAPPAMAMALAHLGAVFAEWAGSNTGRSPQLGERNCAPWLAAVLLSQFSRM